MVTVAKMRANSSTKSLARHPPPVKQRKRKKISKPSPGSAGTKQTERETGLRLSQEFPNSNWLERKIQMEIQAVEVQRKERRYEEDEEDKLLVVDVDKEAHPCIAISEDNDGIGIQVSVLGGDAEQRDLLEETKSGVLKSVAEHSHLTNSLAAWPTQSSQLDSEIRELQNKKTSFLEDLSDLKSIREKQCSKVEDLKQEIMRENQVLLGLQRETSQLKTDRENRDQFQRERAREDCDRGEYSASRKRESYLGNPMPNFNFPPASSSLQQPCQYLNIPNPAKFNLLTSPEYDLQYRRHISPQTGYWQEPSAHFPYSTNCLTSSMQSFSSCQACGAPANFLCSACKRVHYCTSRCQRKSWPTHSRVCEENSRKRQKSVN